MAKLYPINGQVLEWALDDRGLQRTAAAQQLDVDEAVVQGWIDESSLPNKGQFDDLVKLLGCTPSTLFLPEPPETPQRAKVQFRKYPGSPEDVPLETENAMRTAQNVLRVTKWLTQISGQSLDVVPLAKHNENPEEVADRLQTWLNWTGAAQTDPKATDSTAAKAMRGALESRGVVVMHLTMDEDGTRGFSLHDEDVFLIAVNTRDHVRARLFSYAHELCHLALRDDSICLTRNNLSRIERFCNRVAAALLMPMRRFVEFVQRRLGGTIESRDNVVTVRNFFKVSLQAAVIRAIALKLAPNELYDTVIGEPEAKGRGGTYIPGNERTRPRIRVDQYGSGFVNSLIEAEDAGHLKRTQVLDLLRLSDRELATAQSLAIVEAAG